MKRALALLAATIVAGLDSASAQQKIGYVLAMEGTWTLSGDTPEGSDVKISARAAVDIDATVQSYSGLWGIFLAQQNQPWPEEPEPKFEEMTLREMLNLSITGTFRGGRIGDFRISDVQIDK